MRRRGQAFDGRRARWSLKGMLMCGHGGWTGGICFGWDREADSAEFDDMQWDLDSSGC